MEKIELSAGTLLGFSENFLLHRYYQRKPTPWFHTDWWELVCSNQPNVVIAAPRRHAKSTAINHCYGLLAALSQQHPFQLKVCRTYKLAVEKVRQAKDELVTNEKIKALFKMKRIVRDQEDDLVVEMNDGYRFRMMAISSEQTGVRGFNWGTMRPSLVIGDDMEDDEQVLNAERREKMMRWWLDVIMPIGGDDTRFRVIGTILHQDSLLASLLKNDAWQGLVYEGCDEEISEESIIWPEKFDKKWWHAKKTEYQGFGNLAGFNREYRNIAIDETSGFFRREDFRPMKDEDFDRNLTYFAGVDFAISRAEKRDFTVITVAGLDSDGFLHVVDLRRGRWDGKEIIDELFAVEAAWHPSEFFVESGAISKALGPAIELRMQEQQVFPNLQPIVPTKDKESRARSIQARMRARAVRFDREATWFQEFESECIQFPRGIHDDQVDSLALIGLGLARMTTPLTEEEQDEFDWHQERKETMEPISMGVNASTGY